MSKVIKSVKNTGFNSDMNDFQGKSKLSIYKCLKFIHLDLRPKNLYLSGGTTLFFLKIIPPEIYCHWQLLAFSLF